MKHSLWYAQGDRLDYKPVRTQPLTTESIPPKIRSF
jgi:succinate dehydrogenase / fumarate reductase flavoprotein subunit